MKARFLTLLLVLSIQACTAAIHVDKAAIIERGERELIVAVDTAEQLSALEDGLHAYRIALQYRVKTKEPGSSSTAREQEFPFTAIPAKAYEGRSNGREGLHRSYWTVPVKGEVGISGKTYVYDLTKGVTAMEMRLYGATMAGGYAQSSPFGVSIEASQK